MRVTVVLILVTVATIVFVAFKVGVNAAVAVVLGSSVNVAGIGVNVGSSVAVEVGTTSIVICTFFGASGVQVESVVGVEPSQLTRKATARIMQR
jgi:hypothetical protein